MKCYVIYWIRNETEVADAITTSLKEAQDYVSRYPHCEMWIEEITVNEDITILDTCKEKF